MDVEQIGYLCFQGYPKRICSGCTTACCEPVFAYPEADHNGASSDPADTEDQGQLGSREDSP